MAWLVKKCTFVFILLIFAIDTIARQLNIQERRLTQHQKNRPKYTRNFEYSSEHQIYTKLLNSGRYNKHIRPVKDHRQPVIVKIGMCVMMIEEIVERDQIMTLATGLRMRWKDQNLVWKPKHYQNLTWLTVPSRNIWLPYIAIANSPAPYSLTQKSTSVELEYNGNVGFNPTGTLVTRCNLQLKYFPLDWQKCEIRLESWIYGAKYLEMKVFDNTAIQVKELYSNHEWAIVSHHAQANNVMDNGKNMSTVTFKFVLQRQPVYYISYFVIPQVLLALLQTLSNNLPVEHPGRMAMLTSLFIGNSVTQAGIADSTPKSSDETSLLQIYMSIISCNIVVALIVTCVMMYTVLRYPNEEPSLSAMFIAFFSIAWPRKHDPSFSVKTLTNSIRVTPRNLTLDSFPRQVYEKNDSSEFYMNDDAHADKSFFKKISEPEEPQLGLQALETHAGSEPNLPSGDKPRVNLTERSTTINSSLADRRMMFAAAHSFETSKESSTYSSFSASRKNSQPTVLRTDKEEKNSELLSKENELVPSTVPRVLISSPSGESWKWNSDTKSSRMQSLKLMQGLKPVERQISVYDSSPELLINGYISVNPNVETDRSSDKSSNKSRRQKRKNRGEASASEDTRELKRKWLLYCVALDKVIMYAMLAWNVVILLFLFIVMPAFAIQPSPFD